jgi:hypothetical protein
MIATPPTSRQPLGSAEGKSRMKVTRPAAVLAVTLAATALATLTTAGPAQAATITQPFSADSGDSCPYGITTGAITWTYGTTSPLPLRGVGVIGKLTDRPTPDDPGRICADDGYRSTAAFVAYAGRVELDRQSVTVDNNVVAFDLRLATFGASAVDRVVVQVCRDPERTLPPSYCGKPVEYPAPPVA